MSVLRESDVIIAADRGIETCLDLGITPALCIGDFDSASDAAVQAARNRGWELVEHPPEKAATDGELALNEALARGATRIRILGALTGTDRFDHGVANLLLLARADLAGVDIRLIDEMREAFIVRDGESATVTGERGDYVTLLPLSDTGAVVTTWGLKYDLLGIRDLSMGRRGGLATSFRGSKPRLAWRKVCCWAFTNTGDHHSPTPVVPALTRIPPRRRGIDGVAQRKHITPPPLSYKVSCT